MDKCLRILLVDEDEEEYILLRELVSEVHSDPERTKFWFDWASTYDSAVAAFQDSAYDAFLVDYQLGEYNGLDLLQEALRLGCRTPIIMLTGQGDYDVDLAAMQAGAADYLQKNQLSLPLLEHSIRYAIEQKANLNDLERRVQARTKDLAQANEELRAEISRREDTEAALRAANERLTSARDELEEMVAERTAELRLRAEELQALHTATAALLTTLDLEELLGQILRAAEIAIPAADLGSLYFLEGGKDEVPNVLRQVVKDRQPVLLESCIEEQLEAGAEEFGAERRRECSMIAAPLLLEGQCIGVLALTAFRPSAFSDANLRLLVSFAATTTAAIRNARLYDKVQRQSLTDPLTNLYNRRGLFTLGEHEIRHARRSKRKPSLVLFDVDHFKKINDTKGHDIGDEVLSELAERIRGSIRSIDILARYGGDEFAILLPDCGLTGAHDLAERLRQLVAIRPFLTNSGPVPVTISLGLAESANGALDLSEMISQADAAMYQAKQNGRNRVECAGEKQPPFR